MAKEYGEVYFVVNGKPENPKKLDTLNEAEILRQNLIMNFCEKHGEDYSLRFFEANTTMEKEMLDLGYDGLIIKGREMVNYSPNNVEYFKTEDELKRYYENSVLSSI